MDIKNTVAGLAALLALAGPVPAGADPVTDRPVMRHSDAALQRLRHVQAPRPDQGHRKGTTEKKIPAKKPESPKPPGP
ncbi:MAG: hypothetical protein M3O22_07110 [Pseudomonadota bacterium]|nr:hypothetical protein [Pseudomonadota bacterium]